MEECIFCKIIKGESPKMTIFENDGFIAILDLFPKDVGHTLVIPKRHHRNIFDMTVDE